MDELKLSQDYYVYTPKKSAVYPIPEADWERIKKMVGCVIPSRNCYSFFSSLFFGLFASAIFSILSLNTLSNLPNWMMPTNIAIGISSLILGIFLLVIDGQQKDMIKTSSSSIIDEMKTIELKFEEQKPK